MAASPRPEVAKLTHLRHRWDRNPAEGLRFFLREARETLGCETARAFLLTAVSVILHICSTLGSPSPSFSRSSNSSSSA
jgi:hypothetical protein